MKNWYRRVIEELKIAKDGVTEVQSFLSRETSRTTGESNHDQSR
jgi:hypothetical protein